MTILIVFYFAIGANTSSKSMPTRCKKLLATILDLSFAQVSSGPNLVLNIYLVEMELALGGSLQYSHV